MLRYAKLYALFVVQRMKIVLEYRLNFLLGAGCTVFEHVAGLLTIWVVMAQVPLLNGWRYDEVLLVYGMLAMAKAITYMVADNLWTLGRQYIQTGGFDRFLVRPIDPLFHLLADRFDHQGIGHFIVGLVLVVKALVALELALNPLLILYLVIGVLSGGAIFIALNLITCVSAFWIMDSVPVTRVVFEMHEFAKYPLSMYNRSIGTLLTWLIPYGFASFYPASFILGRDVGALAWGAPLMAAGLLFVGYRLWLFGLGHYTSTGS
jgi:ABC-2 type transport system permease protein